MYQIVKKLKNCKYKLKELNKRHFDNIEEQYVAAKEGFEMSQQLLYQFPTDPIIFEYENYMATTFRTAKKAYLSFFISERKDKVIDCRG